MTESKPINYNGFDIIPDKLQGFSMIDRNGSWSCSMTSVKKIKSIIDSILESRKDETTNKA